MIRRHARLILFVIFAVVLGGLAWHWSPGRQVRLHQRDLQLAVENRNWPRVEEFVSPEYGDRWKQNRAAVRERLPIAFQDFLACGILGEEATLERGNDGLILRTRLRVVGSGGPMAQFVMARAEALTEPFAFTWRHQSWRPWDWALVRVDQPQLEIPAEL